MENVKINSGWDTGEFKIKEDTEIRRRNAEDFSPDIRFIENTSPQALFAQNNSLEAPSITNFLSGETDESNREGLTEDEKAKIKEAHPDWPDEIINAIGSWAEYEIYDKANLQYADINGKSCLIKINIDMEQKDALGRTNEERIKIGLVPLDKNGRPIELHHIGQKADSPFAELTFEEHHCNGNDTILHDKTKETEVHNEVNKWNNERREHWKARAEVKEEQ